MPQQQMPAGGGAQDKLPFEQLTGKEPINMGADGMTVSIDQMQQQDQQAQYLRALHVQHQQKLQQQRQQAAAQAMESKIRDVAKEELKSSAIGYIAIGVCLVLVVVLLQQKTSLPLDMPK